MKTNAMHRVLIMSLMIFLIVINCIVTHDSPALVLHMCTGGCGIGNQMFIYASGLGLALQNPEIPACVSGLELTANPVHPQSILRFHVDLVAKQLKQCTRQTTGNAGYFWWWLLKNIIRSGPGRSVPVAPHIIRALPFQGG